MPRNTFDWNSLRSANDCPFQLSTTWFAFRGIAALCRRAPLFNELDYTHFLLALASGGWLSYNVTFPPVHPLPLFRSPLVAERSNPPLVESARREAWVVLVVWAVTAAYTTSYCFTYGVDRTLDNITFVLGFPDWIFWGVVVPWYVCLAFSVWFAYGFMRDDPLGAEATEADIDE